MANNEKLPTASPSSSVVAMAIYAQLFAELFISRR